MNENQHTAEVVIIYHCNGQDRGDLLLTPDEFKHLFGFEPQEGEGYLLDLTVTGEAEG